MTWVAPCGRAGWRTLSDGRVELQGLGVVAHSAGSVSERHVLQTWENWSAEFRSAAKRFGLPAAWLVAIATNESGFLASNPDKQRTVVSSDGYGSIGIMQPTRSVYGSYGYTAEDMRNAQKNIDLGARILSSSAKRTRSGFPAVAAMYNAGHVCATASNISRGNVDATYGVAGYKGAYMRAAVRNLNTALERIDFAESVWPYAAAGALFVAAGAYAVKRGWVPQLR